MKSLIGLVCFGFVCSFLSPMNARADVSGMTFNDFETGTQDWEQNNYSVFTSTPGPTGAGDNFLLLDRTQDARIGAYNQSMDWTGNFTAAGVVGVSVDLKNLGDTELNIRFSVSQLGPGNPVGAYTDDVFLPIGQDWTTYTFSLLPGDLILDGVSDASAELANTNLFRVYHNRLEQYVGGNLFVGGSQPSLGLDNIRAIVPEPSMLTALGFVSVLGGMRRRRRV